jgi:hypothetical protein
MASKNHFGGKTDWSGTQKETSSKETHGLKNQNVN